MTAPITPPPAAAAPAAPGKKEGWKGVLFTAALCALFLWWWFQPAPATAETERNPLYWAGLARQTLGQTQPSLAMRLEVVLISAALRERGEAEAARSLESDWLPPAWSSPPSPPSPPPAELAPLLAQLQQAAACLDLLDIEQGQILLRQAAAHAATLPPPHRAHALWLVTARQASHGLTTEAAQTRQQLPHSNDSFPDWLADELVTAEIITPLVASLHTHPPETPEVIRFASRWQSLAQHRAALREPCLISRDGPAADASQPPATQPQELRLAVESNQLGHARKLAAKNPAAQLAVARHLLWLASP